MLLFSGRTILFPSALPTTLLWGSDRRPGLSIKQFGERQPKNQLAGDILDLNGVVPRILPLSDELIPEILGRADCVGAGGLHVREVETKLAPTVVIEPDVKEEARHGRSPS
jgi:hypothetical protein